MLRLFVPVFVRFRTLVSPWFRTPKLSGQRPSPCGNPFREPGRHVQPPGKLEQGRLR